MVQTAQSWIGDHLSGRRKADSAARRFFEQAKMSSVVMIIRNELGQQPPEMALLQGDDVVEQLAPATAHPALRNSVLPRAWEGSLDAAMLMD